MDGSLPSICILLFIAFFLVTIIVYLFDSALKEISDNELDLIQAEEKKVSVNINKIMKNSSRFANVVHISAILDTFMAALAVNLMVENVTVKIICSIGAIIVVMVFGIIIPKRIGRRKPVRTVKKYVGVVCVIMNIIFPVTFLISCIADVCSWMIGVSPEDLEESVTEEDIISVINEGHEKGVLLASEAEMINNIVEFGDKEARDIMTHRTSVVAVDGNKTLGEVAEYIVKQNNSRFPVYIDDIDNIIGIVNFRDIMTESVKESGNDVKICKMNRLVRKATFIPETRKINVLFKQMQSEKIHMAIVVDEYGQTAGIVAMEDILEEIVGNILDEYDKEDTNIIKKEDGSFIVRGITPVDEISDEIGIDFDEEYETINGYLTAKFERILSNDERPEIVINNIRYKILSVKNRMINIVQIFPHENGI